MKFIIMLLTLFLVGCGDTKIIDGIEYDTYGLFDEQEKRNPNIEYETIVGNVVWSIVLVKTIGAPIYFIGFSLFEPVRARGDNHTKGQIND